MRKYAVIQSEETIDYQEDTEEPGAQESELPFSRSHRKNPDPPLAWSYFHHILAGPPFPLLPQAASRPFCLLLLPLSHHQLQSGCHFSGHTPLPWGAPMPSLCPAFSSMLPPSAPTSCPASLMSPCTEHSLGSQPLIPYTHTCDKASRGGWAPQGPTFTPKRSTAPRFWHKIRIPISPSQKKKKNSPSLTL